MRHYRSYSDEDVKIAAAKVFSIAGLLVELGLVKAGGNYDSMRSKLQLLEIDTSHWTGQGWNKGKQLKNWAEYKPNASLKKHLISRRGHTCECCKLGEWMNELISLELHHVDGDRTNNNHENLQLLCPNCHSYTENYRGKRARKELPVCEDCSIAVSARGRRCAPCAVKHRTRKTCHEKILQAKPTKIDWPDIDTLKAMLAASNYSALARELGVSDNAIRKHLRYY